MRRRSVRTSGSMMLWYEERICSSRCRSREMDCLERLCFLRAIAVKRDHKSSALGEEFHGGELAL